MAIDMWQFLTVFGKPHLGGCSVLKLNFNECDKQPTIIASQRKNEQSSKISQQELLVKDWYLVLHPDYKVGPLFAL